MPGSNDDGVLTGISGERGGRPGGECWLHADPGFALEAEAEEPGIGRGGKLRALSWLGERRASTVAFVTYAHWRDLWSALYSILFVVTASLVFGRLPKLPLAVLVFIPFIYLSLLGTLLLLLGILRDRYIGDGKRRLTRKFLGRESALARYLKRDGQRMLRTAFAAGIYLLAGLVYFAAGPYDNNAGWFLIPALALAMVAIYSLNQHIANTAADGGKPTGGAGEEPEAGASRSSRVFRAMLLRRFAYALVLLVSLFIMYRYLIKPFKTALLG